jgi:hypothetical protein
MGAAPSLRAAAGAADAAINAAAALLQTAQVRTDLCCVKLPGVA